MGWPGLSPGGRVVAVVVGLGGVLVAWRVLGLPPYIVLFTALAGGAAGFAFDGLTGRGRKPVDWSRSSWPDFGSGRELLLFPLVVGVAVVAVLAEGTVLTAVAVVAAIAVAFLVVRALTKTSKRRRSYRGRIFER